MCPQKATQKKARRQASGTQAGRDIKIVHGDEIGGDKIGGNKITVGNISASHDLALGGGNASVSDDMRAVTQAFDDLRKALEKMPETANKAIGVQAIQNLETEAHKGKKADENKVAEWFRVLLTMLPDIGEVAIKTFTNPIQGLSAVFQKIALKAKDNR